MNSGEEHPMKQFTVKKMIAAILLCAAICMVLGFTPPAAHAAAYDASKWKDVTDTPIAADTQGIILDSRTDPATSGAYYTGNLANKSSYMLKKEMTVTVRFSFTNPVSSKQLIPVITNKPITAHRTDLNGSLIGTGAPLLGARLYFQNEGQIASNRILVRISDYANYRTADYFDNVAFTDNLDVHTISWRITESAVTMSFEGKALGASYELKKEKTDGKEVNWKLSDFIDEAGNPQVYFGFINQNFADVRIHGIDIGEELPYRQSVTIEPSDLSAEHREDLLYTFRATMSDNGTEQTFAIGYGADEQHRITAEFRWQEGWKDARVAENTFEGRYRFSVKGGGESEGESAVAVGSLPFAAFGSETGLVFHIRAAVTETGAVLRAFYGADCVCNPEKAVFTLEITDESARKTDASHLIISAFTSELSVTEVSAEETKGVKYIEGKDASCTEAGIIAHYLCEDCRSAYEDVSCTKVLSSVVIPAKGHKEKTTAGREATCTEAGLTEGKECEECGEVLKEQREVPALGHRLKYVPEKKATCTEDGMEAHYACERCGKKYREEGGKEEVSEEELKIASEGTEHQCHGEATCTQGQVCLICGAVVKEALGHDEVVTEGKEATCTRAGRSEAITCRRCGERLKESERIAAKGHEAVRDEGREVTCTENGVTEGSHCERCGEVLEYQYPILAKGHAGEKTEGREATCTEAGLTSGVKCGVCGEILKEQREIAALGHSGSEATCTEDGICERCGIVTEEKKGHAYEEGPTCRERKCTRCGAVKEATGEHEGGEAKCGEQAICEKCGEGYGARKGHEYEKGTCVDCGAKILVISGKQSGCSSSLGASSAAVSAALLAAAALPVLKKRRRFHIRKGR